MTEEVHNLQRALQNHFKVPFTAAYKEDSYAWNFKAQGRLDWTDSFDITEEDGRTGDYDALLEKAIKWFEDQDGETDEEA